VHVLSPFGNPQEKSGNLVVFHARICQNVFSGAGLDLTVDKYVRRVGRPKMNWTKELLKEGSVRFGSFEAFSRALQLPTRKQWRRELDRVYK